MIEIYETEIRISGIESEYQAETSDDVGVHNYLRGFEILN